MASRRTARVVIEVSIRWEGDLIAFRTVSDAERAILGDDPAALAPIAPPGLPTSFTFATVDGREARAFVPEGAHADVVLGATACAIVGPRTVELAVGDSLTIRAGAFELTATASSMEEQRRAAASTRPFAGARAHIAVAALLQGVLLFSGRKASAASIQADDTTDQIRGYLLASEQASKHADPSVGDESGDGAGAEVNDREGNGKAGGGVRASGDEGKMGSALSQARDERRWSAPSREAPEPRAPSLDDARTFGLIGLLASSNTTGAAAWGRDTGGSDRDDVFASHGQMTGRTIGESFGAAGLGLTGVGEGGGGLGGGIGIGRIGTWGHTDGAPGLGTGGRGSPAGIGLGRIGSWWGDGWGIGRGHIVRAPTCYGDTTSVSGRLPPEAIQRVIRQNSGRFRACYDKGLVKNPALAGRVTTKFVIGRDGSVAFATNASSDLPDANVVSCVTRAFGSLSFPQPEGGIVTVLYPWMFSSDR